MDAAELKSIIGHPDYHNRYDSDNEWEHIGILAGRSFQSAEINEIQSMMDRKLKMLGNALFVDGTRIEGCEITLDRDIKVAHLTGGRIFLAGLVWNVKSATLSIPDVETVQIGIWLRTRRITENEDHSFLNPAVGTPTCMHPGAYRVAARAEWGLNIDNLDKPFYPIFTISDGEIVRQIIREKNLDYLDALARYDRDSHGYYVVEGLRVTAVKNADPADDGVKQTFVIAQGLAHIHGYEAKLNHSVRLIVEEKANLYDVTSEAHQYEQGEDGTMTLPLKHHPIEAVKSVRVTKERTATLTHGSYTGCSDNLPNTSVIKLVQVKQGAKVYALGPDYRLGADVVDWSPTGDEPAPGSTYEVTYHYRTNIVPENVTDETIDLSGLVEDSLIELDYSYRMPRRDIIVMYRDCSVEMIRGIPHRYAPVLPGTPPDSILLAEVEQNWTGLPTVKNVAIVAVRMDTLQQMIRNERDLYSLTSENRMQIDAMISAPTSAYGVFVDPLFDDDMRDAGTPQTGLIADEMLQLPMDIDIHSLPNERSLTLDFGTDVLIDQPKHTKCMQVNPYMAFEPLPAVVTLNPSSDRWTERRTNWVSSITQFLNAGGKVLTEVEVEAELRQIPIDITAKGFGPLEPIQVIFDGLLVSCTSNAADAEGKFSGRITIPAGIPTGVKLVRLQGTHTRGEANFIGVKTITTETRQVPPPPNPDPLAQTFTLAANRHVAGVDFWLCKKGVSPIRLDIRETTVGIPNQTIVATCRIEPSQLNQGSFNRVHFDTPALLTAGVEYALILMCDTADHEVGITALGDWDPETGWVTSQAYQTGVLLSSSNNSTWTAHQADDLAFRLLGAVFDAAEPKRVDLSEIDLTGVTDVIPLAEVERTSSDTDVTFVLLKDDVEVVRMQANQLLSFTAPLAGIHKVRAELFGDRYFSPLLHPAPQLVTGKIKTAGDYVSRAWKCREQTKRIMVTMEALTPGTSTLDVYVQTAGGVWTQAALEESEPIGSSWFRNHYFVAFTGTETKIKIVLTGDAASRPYVRKISGVALSA